MKCINRCQLFGFLTRDAELKYTPSGAVVANFSLGVTETFNDKSGKENTKTNYIRCVAWGPLAEKAATLCLKGRTVGVEGKIQTRSWDDQASGKKQYITEILVFHLSDHAPEAKAATPSGTAAAQAILRPAAKPEPNVHGVVIDSDEIPF